LPTSSRTLPSLLISEPVRTLLDREFYPAPDLQYELVEVDVTRC
jgi:hypothetical protein